MIYSRITHKDFLEEELRAQTDAFKQKLDTQAIALLQDLEELYVGQFLKIEDGELILLFSNSRGIPRQGEYLYCMLCPKELRNYRNWGKMTYGDLVKAKTDFSEVVCTWQSPAEKNGYSLIGFRGIDIDFASELERAGNVILILGPNKPPFEYIENLKIVSSSHNEFSSYLLDQDYNASEKCAKPFPEGVSIPSFVRAQLQLTGMINIQGPPGTGKTYLISELCSELCLQNKSVLVTALTNRALVEIAEKGPLCLLMKEKKIFKTKITVDEAFFLPILQPIKEVTPISGGVVLSTFFISSSVAKDSSGPMFDFVIVDEASQALLGMLAAAKLLGKMVIYIGDVKQLPPVISLSEDVIQRKGYACLVDGFKSISSLGVIPNYQMTASYRLPARAAEFTSMFYETSLNSKAEGSVIHQTLADELKSIMHIHGGPTLIKTDLELGSLKPQNALALTSGIVSSFCLTNPTADIAVLTFFKETTKALQRAVFQTIGYKKNVLIETVSRVQGLTTDICIYVVPNTGYHRSLENRLFNVATSRAKSHTIIIVDEHVINVTAMDLAVRLYLERLNKDKSVTIYPHNRLVVIR